MQEHTTDQSSQEIPYGYCKCGCGQKTNILKRLTVPLVWSKANPIALSPITAIADRLQTSSGNSSCLALMKSAGFGKVP